MNYVGIFIHTRKAANKNKTTHTKISTKLFQIL